MKALIEAYWYSPFNIVPHSISSDLFIQISREIMAIQGLHTKVGVQTTAAKWRFARLRDWSTLLSLFPTVNIATLDQLFVGIRDGGVNNTLVGLIVPSANSPIPSKLTFLISCLAEKVLQRRTERLPVVHAFATYAMYWNLSALKDITTEVYKSKIRIIRKHIASGPVLLAETKWDEAHPMRLAQELSGAVIFSSAAVSTQNGCSGGVAILIPSHWQPSSYRRVELVLDTQLW